MQLCWPQVPTRTHLVPLVLAHCALRNSGVVPRSPSLACQAALSRSWLCLLRSGEPCAQTAKKNQKEALGSRSTFLPGFQEVCKPRLPSSPLPLSKSNTAVSQRYEDTEVLPRPCTLLEAFCHCPRLLGRTPKVPEPHDQTLWAGGPLTVPESTVKVPTLAEEPAGRRGAGDPLGSHHQLPSASVWSCPGTLP